MKSKINFSILLLLLTAFYVLPASAVETGANDPMMMGGKTYLLELSGNVLNERFYRSKAVLTVDYLPPSPGRNPLMIYIKGFPNSSARNSILWNSEFSSMFVIQNRVRCEVKSAYARKQYPEVSFHYISPVFYKKYTNYKFKRPETHRDHEDEQLAAKSAKPVKITAQSARLDLNFQETTVTGSVWITGYDKFERSFVKFSAQITGALARNVEQNQENIKYDMDNVRFR